MKNRTLSCPHRRSLERRREKSAAPGGRAAFHSIARIRQHDERGHVAVLGAESVRRPAPQTRLAHQNAAGIHLVDRLRMIDAVAVAASQHAKFVGMFRGVREKVADLKTGFAAWSKRSDRAEQRIFCHISPRHNRTETVGQRRPRKSHEFRLRIQQVDVRGTSMHEQPDHPSGSWSKMRLTRSEWIICNSVIC